jgi:CO dehydrogenase maturation factor
LVVGNKIRKLKDQEFLQTHLPDFDFLGFLPYEDLLIEADLNGHAPFDTPSISRKRVREMIDRL